MNSTLRASKIIQGHSLMIEALDIFRSTFAVNYLSIINFSFVDKIKHDDQVYTLSERCNITRNDQSDSPYKYSEADIKSMLGFLVDNIYVVFRDQVLQQFVGILMDTNCAPLLADLFLYSYEAEFVQKLLRDNNKKKKKKKN
jgi:hypothetical protein